MKIYGIGTDIVNISRIKKTLKNKSVLKRSDLIKMAITKAIVKVLILSYIISKYFVLFILK